MSTSIIARPVTRCDGLHFWDEGNRKVALETSANLTRSWICHLNPI